MPGRDRTGPMGYGAMTGRGLGLCTGINAVNYGPGYGYGYACRRGIGRGYGRNMGYGRGMAVNQIPARPHKELLQEQRDMLLKQIDAIEKQLEDL